ncbi:MAG: flippase [Thermodesulfovibrionales bacterium]
MRVAEKENTPKVITGNHVVGGKTLTGRIASNLLWSILSEAITKGILFFANIYLARALGVSNFGVYTFAQTITFYIWLAVDLGIGMYGIREIAKDKEKAGHIINPLLTLRIFSGIIFFLLYTMSLLLIDLPITKRLAFMGCGLYLLTYSLYSDWILKGLEKFKFIALGSLVSSSVFFISILYFVRSSDDLVSASFIWSLSFLPASVSLIYFLQKILAIKYSPSFDIKLWLFHIKESIYFSISGVLMTIYQYLPILYLSIFFTSYEVGLFSAPYRLIIAIGASGYIIPMAFYPVFSELYLQDSSEFRKTHIRFQKIMLSLGIPVGVIGALFGDEIINLVFGSQYMQASRVFKMLIWLVPLYFLRYTYGSVLLACGLQRVHNVATLIGALCMGITGLFLVPAYNIAGGAISLLLSEILILCSMAYILYKRIKK